MSEQHYRDLMQDAVRELRKARQRIAELERAERNRRSAASIVGMGCHLPCGIEDPDSLWQFFADGRCASAPLPLGRFGSLGLGEQIPNGAWLENPFGFDAQFFRVAPREARLVDPQQRLLLEVAYQTIEHAGIAPDSLRGSKVGVFVGISTQDWFAHLTQHLPNHQIDGAAGPGTNPCGAAGRISFALGFEGPSFCVNTACSSSLVAMHLAMQALRNGECEMALVLGVNAMLSPLTTVTFQRAGMLAKDGRCKTFAADADGYARGEGALAVLLATPETVRERNLRAHVDVLGSAVNQDGATAGLTVPSGTAQQRVVRAALDDAGITANDVQFVEAHGTGTLLGDPIELHALNAVFQPGRPDGTPLHVASAKTNFGHLEAAAGLLSVIKSALQIERGAIAPHLNFQEPTPHGPWADSPLRVPLRHRDYPPCQRRVGGVSSFSFTGTNAHVLLGSSAPADANGDRAPGPYTLPLSGRTVAALRSQCARWATFLANNPEVPLADVAATAALGRTHHAVRVAVVAHNAAQASQQLQQLADGSLAAEDVATTELARSFIAGKTVAWHELAPPAFRRLALPTYAFQRQSFLVPLAASQPTTAAGAEPATDSAATRAAIEAAPAAHRPQLVTQVVQQACAAILLMQQNELSCDEPLLAYGFDSMRAVELANRLEQELGQSMPFSDLIDGATIRNVATAIARRWPTSEHDDQELLRRMQSMSNAEAEKRLREDSGER